MVLSRERTNHYFFISRSQGQAKTKILYIYMYLCIYVVVVLSSQMRFMFLSSRIRLATENTMLLYVFEQGKKNITCLMCLRRGQTNHYFVWCV